MEKGGVSTEHIFSSLHFAAFAADLVECWALFPPITMIYAFLELFTYLDKMYAGSIRNLQVKANCLNPLNAVSTGIRGTDRIFRFKKILTADLASLFLDLICPKSCKIHDKSLKPG